MNTSIEINGLRLYGHHGVMPQEAKVGNIFEVSLRLEYPFRDDDRIDHSLNYAEVVSVVKEVMDWRANLIETVALRMKDALKARFHEIKGGRISVAKITPPISGVEVGSVAAVIAW